MNAENFSTRATMVKRQLGEAAALDFLFSVLPDCDEQSIPILISKANGYFRKSNYRIEKLIDIYTSAINGVVDLEVRSDCYSALADLYARVELMGDSGLYLKKAISTLPPNSISYLFKSSLLYRRMSTSGPQSQYWDLMDTLLGMASDLYTTLHQNLLMYNSWLSEKQYSTFQNYRGYRKQVDAGIFEMEEDFKEMLFVIYPNSLEITQEYLKGNTGCLPKLAELYPTVESFNSKAFLEADNLANSFKLESIK